ncbi:FMN reductase [Pseudomonas asplenii]|uniref:FMN reductase n=2 Tax=Pseudomonas asplenii TaxID=53407 RepID=A0A1H1ZW59_9PSED|nr:FMN reductase [Pseudomonas asplenii]
MNTGPGRLVQVLLKPQDQIPVTGLLATQLFEKELLMSRTLKVVALSGGPYRPSRTLVLTQALLAELAQHLHLESRLIELTDIARPLGAALSRAELSAEVEAQLQAIESADLLIVASPVYRGSYPGLLKHLFDLVDLNALIDTPVLLAATGGSERHALVIDHQLRPLFSFFQALTLPIGIYATETDFSNYQITSEPLKARIRLAVERAAPLFGAHSKQLLKTA